MKAKTQTSRLHTRTIDGVIHVWEVTDLWRLSEGLPVQEKDPSQVIDLERDGWFGGKAPSAGLVLQHMKRILEADLNYPILLDSDGTIMDGAHRACRAILEGKLAVKVIQFGKTPEPSFIRKTQEL